MNRRPRHRRRSRSSGLIPILAVLLIVAASVLVFMGMNALTHRPRKPGVETIATTQPALAVQRPQVVSTATLASFGDLLMHRPIIEACLMEEEYDFSSLFRYVSGDVRSYDYCVANLETSLGGPDCGIRYQGSPKFNCPDAIVDAAADAGFQMLLTANNHCADTGAAGVLRTVDVVRQKGLATLGSGKSAEESKYAVVDINGIKIGMLCYTYATTASVDGAPGFNFQDPISQPGLVNYFLNTDLPGLYAQVSADLEMLKQEGAEATVVYIHWGEEYMLTASGNQPAIAQRLCDLGVDVIIGGHPHVVEPIELLTSSVNPEHRCICIYSLGNAVSNQRREEMSMKSGHTEDGAVFSVSFEKYSDGKVYLRDCDLLPLWVNKYSTGPRYEYNILPLDISKQDQWAQSFGLTDGAAEARASYDRTMNIVRSGLTTCQNYLAQQKQAREQAYTGQ